jgi:hypothetical protein
LRRQFGVGVTAIMLSAVAGLLLLRVKPAAQAVLADGVGERGLPFADTTTIA